MLSEDIDKHERSKKLPVRNFIRNRGGGERRRVLVNAKNIYNGAHVRDQEIHPR